jgi:hypothetical protein
MQRARNTRGRFPIDDGGSPMLDQTRFSIQNFAAATGGSKRGGNIALIDHALANYWNSAQQPAARIAELTDIARECSRWLRKKVAKSEYKTIGFFTTKERNVRLTDRKLCIRDLGNAALQELKTLTTAANPALQNWLNVNSLGEQKAGLHYAMHKMNRLGALRYVAPGPQLKSLSAGYGHERTTYLNSHKTMARAGTGVHGTHTGFRGDADGLEFFLRKAGNSPDFIKKAMKLQQRMQTLNMDQISLEDYTLLDQIGRSLGEFGSTSGHLTYLKKQQRYQHLMLPDANGKLRDFQDNLVSPGQPWMYAMDENGSLFAKVPGVEEPGAFFFNHSSFNAGKDVICAGMLLIDNGVLKVINNESGHYKPSRTHLINCLHALQADGVDLSACVVGIKHEGNNEAYYLASTLMAQPNTTWQRHRPQGW